MHHLPPEVKREFDARIFVVKRSNQKFNLIDPDQSQEWLSGIGKNIGGIIGIFVIFCDILQFSHVILISDSVLLFTVTILSMIMCSYYVFQQDSSLLFLNNIKTNNWINTTL